MNRPVRPLAYLAVLLAVAPAAAQERGCAGVECSGAGTCFAERGVPLCLCEPGHVAIGLACVAGGDEEAALRARRDPTVGDRAVVVAMAEVGRERREVGDDLGRHPEDLARYLMPHEWWCGDFVSWVYEAAGAGFTGGASGGWLVANNVAIRDWFERRGLWVDRSSGAWRTFEPRPGDYVRFPTELGGHAGIVHRVSGDTLYTIEGNVGSRVQTGRYFHFRQNRLIEGIGVLALPHEPPRVEAGEDTSVVWPRPLALRAALEDDGPDERLAIAWSQVSGPGVAHFEDAGAPETACRFSAPGSYVLRLTAFDGEHRVQDEIVVEARENRPPLVAARLVELSAGEHRALLSAGAEDDEPLSTQWTLASGPGTVHFDDAASLETAVRFSAPGLYALRFRASDGELEASEDVLVDVPASVLPSCATGGATSGLPAWVVSAAALALRRRRR